MPPVVNSPTHYFLKHEPNSFWSRHFPNAHRALADTLTRLFCDYAPHWLIARQLRRARASSYFMDRRLRQRIFNSPSLSRFFQSQFPIRAPADAPYLHPVNLVPLVVDLLRYRHPWNEDYLCALANVPHPQSSWAYVRTKDFLDFLSGPSASDFTTTPLVEWAIRTLLSRTRRFFTYDWGKYIFHAGSIKKFTPEFLEQSRPIWLEHLGSVEREAFPEIAQYFFPLSTTELAHLLAILPPSHRPEVFALLPKTSPISSHTPG